MSQNQDQYSCKRVVLLFKLQNDDEDIVKAFLRYCHHPESEYEENKHFIHLDPDRGQKTAHIVIDINKDDIESPDLSNLPHEVYKVELGGSNDL
jgi:hypothetical protein